MDILDDTSDDPHKDISQLDVYKRIRKQSTQPHIVNYQYHAIPVSRKGIIPALGMSPVIDLKHITVMPRDQGCIGLRKIFRAVKSGLDAERLQRKNKNKRQVTTKEFRLQTRGKPVKTVCETIYPVGHLGQESFLEVIHQFGESWKMEECISKYGEDMKDDIDRAFRTFEKISLGELAGILAVIGEDKLKIWTQFT